MIRGASRFSYLFVSIRFLIPSIMVVAQTAIRSTLSERRLSINIKTRKKPATSKIRMIKTCWSKLRTFCRPLMMSTTNSISQVKPTITPITIKIIKSEGANIKHKPSKMIKMPRNKSLFPEIFKELTKPSRNLSKKLGPCFGSFSMLSVCSLNIRLMLNTV